MLQNGVMGLCGISIHSLRMEGDERVRHVQGRNRCISIHSLRMEGDKIKVEQWNGKDLFQSTPSAWRETALCGAIYGGV